MRKGTKGHRFIMLAIFDPQAMDGEKHEQKLLNKQINSTVTEANGVFLSTK